MLLKSLSIPCLTSDLKAFERMLTLWSDPRFSPVTTSWPDQDRPALLVVLNAATPNQAAAFQAAWDAAPALHEVFASFHLEIAGLEGEEDLYVRDSQISHGRFGNKAGPNFLFQRTLHAATAFGGFTFLHELDCFGMAPGWLEQLAQLALDRPTAWVVGARYTGAIPVGRIIQHHLNGNALYHVGQPRFMDFVDNVWMTRLLTLIRTDPNLAYDCWWATEYARASSAAQNDSWQIVKTYAPFITEAGFIANLLHPQTAHRDLATAQEIAGQTGLALIFIHGAPATEFFDIALAQPDADLNSCLQASVHGSDTTPADFETLLTQPAHLEQILAGAEALNSSLEDAGMLSEMALAPLLTLSLPGQIEAADLKSEALLGSWHPHDDSSSIWMGPGRACLHFALDLPEGPHKLRLRLSGHSPLDLSTETIAVSLLGAEPPEIGTIAPDGSFEGVAGLPAGQTQVSLLLETDGFARAEGDLRQLSYAFFALGVEYA